MQHNALPTQVTYTLIVYTEFNRLTIQKNIHTWPDGKMFTSVSVAIKNYEENNFFFLNFYF